MANSIQLQGNPYTWTYSPQSTDPLQGSSNTGSTYSPQTTSTSLQGSSPTLEPTANPMNYVDPEADVSTLGATTTVDPVAAAAAAKAAEDAARAGALRTEVTNLVNSIKNIYNQRYGQVDAAAGEQVGKLNDRFATESGDLTGQITNESNALGAAHAASGTFDSSYRGNNVDTVTKAGQNQIRDLGTGLQDDIAKIASWISQQKTGFDSAKGGLDTVLSHLAETTDPDELTQVRNTLDSRIAELQSTSADNNTAAQNATALATIAPTNARAVKLQTTLSQIIAGNADSTQKTAIAQSLIANSGLTADEQQKLAQAFQSDLSSTEEQPTA